MSDFGVCKGCSKERYIENKKNYLCSECNFIRRNGKTRYEAELEKRKNKKTIEKKKVDHSKRNETAEKRKVLLERDRRLYKYIFDTTECICQECDDDLPDEFEDNDGNIICISQYSHILSKGAWGEFRHHKLNINRLCPTCHDRWEFGDKENMKIYPFNMVLIDKIRENPKLLIE